jgi:hypothetical protein
VTPRVACPVQHGLMCVGFRTKPLYIFKFMNLDIGAKFSYILF